MECWRYWLLYIQRSGSGKQMRGCYLIWIGRTHSRRAVVFSRGMIKGAGSTYHVQHFMPIARDRVGKFQTSYCIVETSEFFSRWETAGEDTESYHRVIGAKILYFGENYLRRHVTMPHTCHTGLGSSASHRVHLLQTFQH